MYLKKSEPDTKSKHGPERDQHLTDFDDFGMTGQRGHNHQNLLSIDPYNSP